jgi:hypothetical protein
MKEAANVQQKIAPNPALPKGEAAKIAPNPHFSHKEGDELLPSMEGICTPLEWARTCSQSRVADRVCCPLNLYYPWRVPVTPSDGCQWI